MRQCNGGCWVGRGARDHGLRVVGLPSRFATFQTDGNSWESVDLPSPSASPTVSDWWGTGPCLLSQAGYLAMLTKLVQSFVC